MINVNEFLTGMMIPEKQENKELTPEQQLAQIKEEIKNFAVQLDENRLKLIDEISRLILEIKKEFPQLSEQLEKKLINLSEKEIQQLIKILTELKQNPEFPEAKINEAMKILKPVSESPPEFKLVLALSNNDFKTADTAIKDIIANPASIKKDFSTVILNVLQELKTLGIPIEFKENQTPLKELEQIVLKQTGIEIPKEAAKILAQVLNEKPIYAEISVVPAKTNIQNIQVNANSTIIEIPISLNQNFQNFQNLQNENAKFEISENNKVEVAISLFNIPSTKILTEASPLASLAAQPTKELPQETTTILQPWQASTQIPKEERDFWLKTELPLTPQTLNLREAILSFGKLPENPEIVKAFASALHELSLQTEQRAEIPKEQINLLWRVVQTMQGTENNSQLKDIMPTFLKYQPLGNFEGELFKNLPEPVRKELLKELADGKTWQPEVLQKAIEKIIEKLDKNPEFMLNERLTKHEDIKNILQNFKEQIQWTRIDQDTRVQNDKENIFYFMHQGELQKGRLKIKDQRKGDGKKKQNDSSISFTIETKTKNLGNVYADLTLGKNILNIKIRDDVGTASVAVQEERETLAQELADIGISLGELVYGKTPKVQIIHIAKKEESKSGLDVRA